MDKREVALELMGDLGKVARSEITPEMDLVGHLGIDSAKALQLLVELEKRLGIEISDEDAARMETVGDVLDYLAAAV